MTTVTIDLDDRVAAALSRWTSREAARLGPPHLSASEVVNAALVVALRYTDVTDALRSQIRHQRSAGREHGQS